MADDLSDSRESENNSWVIAGSEALAVEDLGLETSGDPLAEEDEPSKESHQASPAGRGGHHDPEETELKIQEAEKQLPAKETPSPDETLKPSLVPSDPGEVRGSQGGEEPSPPGPLRGPIVVHELGPGGVEASASSNGEDLGVGDRDVEGLRQRKGREVAPAGPVAPRSCKEGSPGGGDDGESTKWLFGLLALAGLVLLVILGVVMDTEEVPVDLSTPGPNSDVDGPHLAANGSPRPASPPLEPTVDAEPQRARDDVQLATEAPKGPQSLDAMGLLLDKLAKENQDIRLMQAELQAQKEELQALLQKTEGEALAFTSQHQAVAAAQAELRLLRGEAQGPGDGRPGPDQHGPKPESPEAEVRRLRATLASAGRELARAAQKIPPGAEGLRSELSAVGRRLAQEAAAAEDGPGPSGKEAEKRRKEAAWHKRPGGAGELHHDRRERPRGHPSAPKSHSPPGPKKHHEAKPGKDVRKPKRPTTPGALWEALARHPFRAPQGCAGMADCARREGLAPVQRETFLPLVQRYLAGLGWAEHYGALAEALGGFFGADGAFAHDRVSFVDFLDEAEDALEELARSLGRSREDPDDFEEVILRQVGAVPAPRFGHGDAHHPNGKERKSPPPGGRNGRDHRARG